MRGHLHFNYQVKLNSNIERNIHENYYALFYQENKNQRKVVELNDLIYQF